MKNSTSNDNDSFNYYHKHINGIIEKLIKAKKLYEQKNQRTISNYEITNYLNDHTHISTTYATINSYLSPAQKNNTKFKKNIDITLIMELCKYFNADPYYVLALPEENFFPETPPTYGIKVKQLDDPNYIGTFHCYRLSTSMASDTISDSVKKDTLRINDSINHSILEIKVGNDGTSAIMESHTQAKVLDKTVENNTILTGVPLLYTKNNNVQINLTSPDGELYTIFFDYQPFDSGEMYYREAIFLSSSKGTHPYPMVSKMIITRRAINEKDYEYVRGLLAFNVSTLIISTDKFKSLAATDFDIQKFKSDFRPYFRIWSRNFVIIPENIAENDNPNTELNKIELKKILLKLRNHSYSDAQIIVGNSYKASVIARDLQINTKDPLI